MPGADRIRSCVSGLSTRTAVRGDEVGDAGDYAFVAADGVLLWKSGECHFALVGSLASMDK